MLELHFVSRQLGSSLQSVKLGSPSLGNGNRWGTDEEKRKETIDNKTLHLYAAGEITIMKGRKVCEGKMFDYIFNAATNESSQISQCQ